MDTLEISALYTITNKQTGEITTVQIRQANPIRNWFNICGDRDGDRRWINDYEWIKVSDIEHQERGMYLVGFDYGEHVGNTIIKVNLNDSMKEEKRQKTNLLKAMIHIRDNNKLPAKDVVTCIDGIAEFKKEIEACDNYIDATNDFVTTFYN